MITSTNPMRDPRRKQSEELAFRAEQAWQRGERDEARNLFAAAATLEEEVAREIPESMPRVRSILAVSAVALWYKAGAFAEAKRAAYRFLADGGLNASATREVEQLVDRCSREAELARVSNDSKMIPIEVKLDGGRIGVGVAPEGVARRRREVITSLLMRTAELEADRAFRHHGESELSIHDQIEIFEVPPVAASYGLRFYVATGTQQVLPMTSSSSITPERVVDRFLQLAHAAASGPDAIRAQLPDKEYAHAFLAGFAEIAPDGVDVGEVACSSPTWKMPGAPAMVFDSGHRKKLRTAAAVASVRDARPGEKVRDGTLTAVVSSRQETWIKVKLPNVDEELIVMVEDRRMRVRVATLVADDAAERVRVFTRRSEKARRDVLTEIVPLGAIDESGPPSQQDGVAGPQRGAKKRGR